MPKYPGAQNLISQPLYDTVRLAAVASQTVSFFTVPKGSLLAAGINKTLAHTNLIQPGRLESEKNMTVTALSFRVVDLASGGAIVTKVDYSAVYNYSFLEFKVGGDTKFLTVPLCAIPSAGMETGYFSNITAAPTEFKLTHGIGSIANRYPLEHPIPLEGNETFQVDITVEDTIAAVTDVQLVLWGEMTRPAR